MRLFIIVFALLMCAPAWAADWTVQRLRGEVSQKIGLRWVDVSRGDVIDDNGSLRTGPDGRVGLVRGRETIALEGNTLISIKDAGAARMTTVIQEAGTITVDVERRNVQHFSVQTKFLAAVVKGTAFTVRADARGTSVSVSRGVVQVQDSGRDLVADIRPGQSASVTSTAPLDVTGGGRVNVFTFEGVPVVPGTTEPVDANSARAGGSKGNGGTSGNNSVGAAVSATARASNGAGASQAAGAVGAAVSTAAKSTADSAKQSGASVGQAVSSVVKETVAGASAVGQSTAETAKDVAATASAGVGKALGLLK